MNDHQESVMQILAKHRGRHNAIKGMAIARLLNCDYRQVRIVINKLIEVYPIASATQKPAGYFLIENTAEAWEYREVMRKRIIGDARRLRDFNRSAGRKLDMVIQGKLI